MTADRLAELLSGNSEPQTDEERGAIVLVALNYHQLRAQEDRERYANVKRVAGELAVGWPRAKRQAA